MAGHPDPLEINYDEIPIPAKPTEGELKKFNYRQRRAHILRLIKKAGDPHAFTTTGLGEMYGKSAMQIWKDLAVIKQYIENNLGEGIRAKTAMAYQSVVDEGLKSGVYQDRVKAVELLERWNKWLFDLGVQKKAPTEINMKGSVEYTFAEAYKEEMEEDDEQEGTESTGEGSTD